MPVSQEAQGRQPGRILAQGGARPPDHLVGVVVLQRHDTLDQVGTAMAAGPLEHGVGQGHGTGRIVGGEAQLGESGAGLVAGIGFRRVLDDRLQRGLGLRGLLFLNVQIGQEQREPLVVRGLRDQLLERAGRGR